MNPQPTPDTDSRAADFVNALDLYGLEVLRFALSYAPRGVAEDLVADAFVAMYQMQIAPERMRAFLLVSIRNACVNYVKTPPCPTGG